MTTRRNYNQNCPIARGLDALGERWTLLILVTTRLGTSEAKRKAALRRIKFNGNQDATDATRSAFALPSA